MTITDELSNYLKELETLKIEFTDKDDGYHRLDSHIKRVNEDFILLDSPEGILPADGSMLNLIFPRKNGVLIARCSFLEKQTGTLPGIKVSYPYNTQILERREYVRVPLRLRTKITCSFDKNSAEKESFYVVTRNISGSGICFLYDKSLQGCEEEIKCKIYINDGNPNPIRVKCKYVYSKKARIKNNIFYITALKYISLSEEDSARIVKECFKYQINHRHVK